MTETSHNKKILVIEDDNSLRKAIVEKLTLKGFDAVGAEDGEKGIELSTSSKPDLVVLDLLMPKVNGLTVLKMLHAKFGKDLPIIILTNVEADDNIVKDLTDYKATRYLVKSDTKLDSLVGNIKEILKLED
jgi:DNA-binding response OmpR family regulator